MDQGSQTFLIRQVVLTELSGGRIEEFNGGCLSYGDALWIGLWQPEAVEDFEELLSGAIENARDRVLPFGGVLATILPETEKGETIQQLSETAYLLGYPRAQGLNLGGPDIVQVLHKSPDLPPGIKVDQVSLDHPVVTRFLEAAMDSSDRIDSPTWGEDMISERMEVFLASAESTETGVLCQYSGELLNRMCALWVDPAAREAHTGPALVAAAATHGLQQGKMLSCVWSHREGRLRYFFNKLGFEDALSALYFLPEE